MHRLLAAQTVVYRNVSERDVRDGVKSLLEMDQLLEGVLGSVPQVGKGVQLSVSRCLIVFTKQEHLDFCRQMPWQNPAPTSVKMFCFR